MSVGHEAVQCSIGGVDIGHRAAEGGGVLSDALCVLRGQVEEDVVLVNQGGQGDEQVSGRARRGVSGHTASIGHSLTLH